MNHGNVGKGNERDQEHLTQIVEVTNVFHNLLLPAPMSSNVAEKMANISANELESWALDEDGEKVRYAMENGAFSELEQSHTELAEAKPAQM